MRIILWLAMVLGAVTGYAQSGGFTFTYTGPNQIIVGSDCMEPLNWGHPNTPTATSNIPGGMVVSFNIFSISGGYSIGDQVPGGTTVTVFYQAIDNFGNSALFGFNIAFIDVLPPTFVPFTLPPANLAVSCINNVPPVANVEATDNCENENTNLTITFTEMNNAQQCTGGTIMRTWVADDDLGNLATFKQTITVTPDNIPPVISNNLVDGMAPCSTAMAQYSTWLTTQRNNFTATDAGCGLESLTDNAPPPSQITSFCGEINVTFTATDVCGNSSTVLKTFTVTNNVPPVITMEAANASGNCSQSNIQSVFNTWINNHGGAQATDDCSSIFWSTFPTNPHVSDTCDAEIEVMFIASDGCNNFDTTMASFMVVDETGPNITAQPSTMVLSCTTNNLDSLLMDWLVEHGNSAANDLCTPVNELIKGFEISGNALTMEEVLEAWADSLESGCRDGVIIQGVGVNNVKALLPVTFTWTDKCENTAGATGFFGITDNGRPTFVTPPQDTSFACTSGPSWESTLETWYNTAGNAEYMDVCSEVTVMASITLDSAMNYLAAALDTACNQGVSVSIAFTLTDDCGNMSLMSASASFLISDTLPPVLTETAVDLQLSCSPNAQDDLENWLDTLGGAQASDGCGDLNWMFSWTDTSGVMTGIPFKGPYPQLNADSCTSALTIIFMAEDGCQNMVMDTALVTLIDTTGPMLSFGSDTIHLACGDTIPLILPEAIDDCDPMPELIFQDSVSMDSCTGGPGLVIRTWTASDICGNTSEIQMWFFSIDTIPPTFELPADSIVACDPDSLMLINVMDHCDPDPLITWVDSLDGPACRQTLTRTWTVTDNCGNTATAEQIIDLSDDTPPVLVQSPGHVFYSCDPGSPDLQTSYENWLNQVEVADGCSDFNFFIALSGSYDLGDTTTWPGTSLPDSIMAMCGSSMAVEGDLVAYDVCGNIVVDSISFTVMDTLPPVFASCPDLLVFETDSTCLVNAMIALPDVLEGCFPDDVTISYSLNFGDTISIDTGFVLDTMLKSGEYVVEWMAVDCDQNMGSCRTAILVVDENAVSVTCPSDTLVELSPDQCSIVLLIAPPTFTTGSCGTGVSLLQGIIEGNAEPDTLLFAAPDDSISVTFQPGLHRVNLIAQDSTGDADTCSFEIEVRDITAPIIGCSTDTIIVHPSGLDTIALSTDHFKLELEDACGVDSVWFNPPLISCADQAMPVDVTISVTDISGNENTCLTQLTVLTPSLTPGWERGLCDDTLRLYASIPDSPAVMYTYMWTGPLGFTSDEENPLIPDTDTTFSGVYELTIQSENGCVSTGSVEVIIAELSAPVLMVNADTICAGEEIVLSTQPFGGDVLYSWYAEGSSGDSLLGTTTDPEFMLTLNSSGSFTFFASVIQDTCDSGPSENIVVFVAPVPIAEINALPGFLCFGDSLLLAPVNVEDTLAYQWSGPNGFMSSDAIPAGIPAMDIDSGSVFYLSVSTSLCTSLPDSVTVQIQSPPVIPVITGYNTSCENGSIQLVAQSGADLFTWIQPDSTTIMTTTDTLVIDPVSFDQAGNWYVIAFQNGCPSDTSDAFAVSVDTGITVEINAPTNVCAGEMVQFSINIPGDGTFDWSGPGGFMSSDPTPVVEVESGIYMLSYISNTGCEASDTHQIQVDVLPVINNLITDAENCADGVSSIQIHAEITPAFNASYELIWNGPGLFTANDSTIVIDSVTSVVNGTYSLVIINGDCISDTAFIDINLTDNPEEPVIVEEQQFCYGDSIILSIDTPLNGASYTWVSSDTMVTIPSPGTLIIPDATNAWTGIYDVYVTINGCSSETARIGIMVNAPLILPVIIAPSVACEGDSLILSSNIPDGVSIQWNGPNGFTSTEAEPVLFPVIPENAGGYTVSYVQDGCPSEISTAFVLEVQTALTTPVMTTDLGAICLDDPTPVTLCIDPATIVPGAEYSWMLNEFIPVAGPNMDTCLTLIGNPLMPGTNMITVIATLRGCASPASESVLIRGDEFPKNEADAGLPLTYCPNEEFNLDGNDPAPGTGMWTSSTPGIIISDPAIPQPEVNGLQPGMYTFTWTLSFGSCINYSADSITIEIFESPVTLPDTIDVPFGQTIEFIVTSNDMVSMGPFILEVVTPPSRGNALHAGNGIFRYTPNIGFVGTDMFIYRICATDCPEECSEAVVILRVGNEDDCFVPSLFTPNEDGVNDRLIIPCLETSRYPDNRIMIFNEWGDQVYSASPYLNDWDGTYSGDALPVGTYFYIMDFGDGSDPKRTFLVLER